MSDISGLLGSTGVALEAQAYKTFGAAVENQVGGTLSKFFNIGGAAASTSVSGVEAGVWDPTPYASALSQFKGGYDPKLKFLFKVNFEFHEEAAQMASSLGVDTSELSRDITFVIKQIDLPKVDFDYEEINMYNFRTKFLKGIKHRELNIIMYDDVANHAMSLINVYMQILSPITRTEQSPTSRMEDSGFAFNPTYNGVDTASRGAIVGNRKDILRKLTIEQFYVNMSNNTGMLEDVVRINRFAFINPRIFQFDISDQDHEQGGQANTISLVIDYDALHILTNQEGTSSTIPQFGGGDILANRTITPASIQRSAAASAQSSNPFVNILTTQGSRLVKTTVSNALSKAVGSAGGGMFGSAIYNVSGILGNAAGNTLKSAGNNIAQGIVKPSVSIVKDNGAK